MTKAIQHTVIEIIDKKIEHIQRAIQYLDAAQEDDLQLTIKRLGNKISLLESRKKSLQKDLDQEKQPE